MLSEHSETPPDRRKWSVYAGDSTRVNSVLNGVTTGNVGNHVEWTGDNSAAAAPRRIAGRRADGCSSTGIHARRQWQNRGAVLSSVGWNALYRRHHTHRATLHRANRRRGHRLVLLRRPLLRSFAWPLHPGGYAGPQPGQSAESQPVCVHPQ